MPATNIFTVKLTYGNSEVLKIKNQIKKKEEINFYLYTDMHC